MAFYREETKKIYYCGRCGKQIKGKGSKAISFEQVIMTPDGGTTGNYLNSRVRGIYLCPKCLKDFNAFLKNKYPTEQSEKEKVLEDKLSKVKDEVSEDIGILYSHISALKDYIDSINNKVNESAYLSDDDIHLKYLYSRLAILKSLDRSEDDREESEETNNE